jgi:aspartate aminotransferase
MSIISQSIISQSIISTRVQKMQPSPTLAITAKANELKKQGKNIISLSVGEPDFDTPLEAKQGGIDAINQGKTKYTAGYLPEI